MAGEQVIAAPRRKVWAALNDPEVLRQAIDGCETFERTAPDSFAVRLTTGIGPVKLGFGGAVTLADVDAPNGYTLIGEGTGAGAGFARGKARVSLADVAGSATRISYQVEVEVGGKLAQIGARLIDQAARKQADSFFTRFASIVAEGGSAAPAHMAGWSRGPTWLVAVIMALAALAVGVLAGRLWG